MLSKLKKQTRTQFIIYFILTLSFISSIVFVNYNYSFYDRPIAKVTTIETIEIEDVRDRHGNEDTVFTQAITATIKNGDYIHKPVQLMNTYSTSGAYDHELHIGTEVFITLEQTDELKGTITNIKRDKYIVAIAWVFILVLLAVGRIQGFFAVVSLGLNLLLLSYALDIYVNTGLNLLWICAITVVLFTVTSLLLVNGFNEKTYAAIITTLLGTFSALFIAYIAMKVTAEQGLHYEEMQFLTRPYQLVFMAGLFIGSLGAVMDVAISISAAMFELYEKDHTISVKSLKESGLEIGRDIMGTMTNILFLAYVSGSIPMLILSFKNFTALNFTLSINLSLEIARALAGGVGIVLTIPIGLYVSIFFVNRKRAKQ